MSSADEQVFRNADAAKLRMEAAGRPVAANRFNAVLRQSIEQFSQDRVSAPYKRGRERAPEYPPGPFENSLTVHVLDPLV